MIPAGYMLKKVVSRPEWLSASGVKDLYSVSGCFSTYFSNYVNHWRHNGYWFFNQPSDMEEILNKEGADRSGLTLFYYEVYEEEFGEDAKVWSPFAPDGSFVTHVEKPKSSRLQGYDVTTFSAGTSPECSPPSCNSVAGDIQTNEHCLLETLDDAKAALEGGRFNDCEPGPFRIFAVYVVDVD